MSILQQLNDDISVLTARVERSLVQIKNGQNGGAAGIIWHPGGLIVTNAHVVNRLPLSVTLHDSRVFKAKVLACDVSRDLAILSIGIEGLIPIALGDSASLGPGQFVIAMGHPWGIKNAVTAGIIMGNGYDYLKIKFPENLVAVNLPLRPGNSGGPLVDSEGLLVGINTIMTGSDSGLAIPVNAIKEYFTKEIGSLV